MTRSLISVVHSLDIAPEILVSSLADLARYIKFTCGYLSGSVTWQNVPVHCLSRSSSNGRRHATIHNIKIAFFKETFINLWFKNKQEQKVAKQNYSALL